jgi:hypothetical protein
VKETAERVILLFKEVDSPASEATAADEAAAAFCAFCYPPDPAEGSAAIAAQTRVAVRAVSCLHKLLTHRVVPAPRLTELLDAFERLGISSGDDAITPKVPLALLRLLAEHEYLNGLPNAELGRAFPLLFWLRSFCSAASAAAAVDVGPLAAIPSGQSGNAGHEDGVIKITAKSAFRHVASDLSSCAAERMSEISANDPGIQSDALPYVVRASQGALSGPLRAVRGEESKLACACHRR